MYVANGLTLTPLDPSFFARNLLQYISVASIVRDGMQNNKQ